MKTDRTALIPFVAFAILVIIILIILL